MLSAVVAVGSFVSGISGNWVAGLGQPSDAVVWVVCVVAVAATAVLAVVALRGGRDEPSTAPVPVSVVGPVDSVDTGCDVWPLDEFTAARATVHTAIGRRLPHPGRGPAKAASAVPYVARVHDAAVRDDIAAAIRGEHQAVILLLGTSSTGKTRSLFETVHAICEPARVAPDRGRRSRGGPGWQVVSPAGREALRELPDAGVLSRAPSVLWLNELQGFLGPNGTGLSRRLLEDLHASTDRPLVVVATVWPDKLDAERYAGLEAAREIRELFEASEHVHTHPIADRLTEPEELEAHEAAQRTGDQRMTDALTERGGFGFTQALAGARQLLEFYEHPTDRGTRLVLEAAGDYRRLGGKAPLTLDLLAGLARALWDELYAPQPPAEDLWQSAVAAASRPLPRDDPEGMVRALVPLDSGYTLADYLEQHLRLVRHAKIVTDPVWAAVLQYAEPSDKPALAGSAASRGREGFVGCLLSAAAASGVLGARPRLTDWLDKRGRHRESEQLLRDAVTENRPFARRNLAHWLARQGRDDETEQLLRDAATAGEPFAHNDLVKWLEDRGRDDETEQLRRDAITAGKFSDRKGLIKWLEDRGRGDETEQLRRDEAAFKGDYEGLLRWLEDRGRGDEIEQLLRDAVTAEELCPRLHLIWWLEDHGRDDETEQLRRDEVSAGGFSACEDLIRWLKDRSRDDEAEQVRRDEAKRLRREIAEDGFPALQDLIKSLKDHGRDDEIEQLLHDAITAEVGGARLHLAQWLEDHGRDDEAEQILHDALTANEGLAYRGLAYRALASWHTRHGRDDEAEQLLHDALTANEGLVYRGLAYRDLASWHTRHGRDDEAEQILHDALTAAEGRAYRSLLHRHLAHRIARQDLGKWLEDHGRDDEAEQLLRNAVSTGEANGIENLTLWLTRHDRADEAAIVRVHGVDAFGVTVWP